MRRAYTPLFLTLLSLPASAQQFCVKEVAAERLEVTGALDVHPHLEATHMVRTYKARVDSIMSPVLGMSQVAMSAHRPESLLGNWAADALVEASTCQGGPRADFALANIGGLRSDMPKSVVRVGDIFLISPFQSTLVMLELKGTDVMELMRDIAAVGGEAVSTEVRLSATHDGKLLEVTVGGNPIDKKRTYRIATLDYLAEGNDRMYALRRATKYESTGIVIRDILMEHIIKHRTITSRLEGRITIKEEAKQ